MTDYRQQRPNPPSEPVSRATQAPNVKVDISQMHTQLLDHAEPPRAPTGGPSRSRPPDAPAVTTRRSPTQSPLATRTPAQGVPLDPRSASIAEHLRTAVRLREEAYQLLDTLKVCSAQATDVSQRWLALVERAGCAPEQAPTYAHLEEQMQAVSRQFAGLWQRWSACITQARDHEDAARLTQSAAYPRR